MNDGCSSCSEGTHLLSYLFCFPSWPASLWHFKTLADRLLLLLPKMLRGGRKWWTLFTHHHCVSAIHHQDRIVFRFAWGSFHPPNNHNSWRISFWKIPECSRLKGRFSSFQQWFHMSFEPNQRGKFRFCGCVCYGIIPQSLRSQPKSFELNIDHWFLLTFAAVQYGWFRRSLIDWLKIISLNLIRCCLGNFKKKNRLVILLKSAGSRF